MTWSLVVSVCMGGLVGAPTRAVVDRAVMSHRSATFAFGTLVVNATGSILFGVLTGLHLSHHLGSVALALFGTGFCGAYTTFSTFTYEVLGLLEDGRIRYAAAIAGLSVATALAGAVVGVAIGLAL